MQISQKDLEKFEEEIDQDLECLANILVYLYFEEKH